MKQVIRLNTFETNSSSTHCMIIIPDKYFDDFEAGKLFYVDKWNKELREELGKEFVSLEELSSTKWWEDNYNFESEKEDYANEYGYNVEEDSEELEAQFLDSFLSDNDIIKSEGWHENLEQDETTYTTESGDVIHIRCAHGYDY